MENVPNLVQQLQQTSARLKMTREELQNLEARQKELTEQIKKELEIHGTPKS